MKLDESFDFGFTAVSEDELKQLEKEYQSKAVQATKQAESLSVTAVDSLHGLRNMVVPLLQNLMKDPEKSYIFWPNRVVKIKDFMSKIDSFVESESKKLK